MLTEEAYMEWKKNPGILHLRRIDGVTHYEKWTGGCVCAAAPEIKYELEAFDLPFSLECVGFYEAENLWLYKKGSR